MITLPWGLDRSREARLVCAALADVIGTMDRLMGYALRQRARYEARVLALNRCRVHQPRSAWYGACHVREKEI